MRKLLPVAGALLLACNAILGFDEPTLRQNASVGSSDGGGDGSNTGAGDGSPGNDASGDGSDSSVDGGDSGLTRCKPLGSPVPFSATNTGNDGPSLAWAGDRFGAVWHDANEKIWFNTIPPDGGAPTWDAGIQLTYASATFASLPRVAGLTTGSFVVGTGELSSGSATGRVSVFTAEGVPSSSTTHGTDAGTVPPEIDVAGYGTFTAFAMRHGGVSQSGASTGGAYTTMSLPDTAIDSTTRAVAVAWRADGNHVVVAHIENGSPPTGKVEEYLASGGILSPGASIPFTDPTSAPPTNQEPQVAIAPLGASAYAVAWIRSKTLGMSEVVVSKISGGTAATAVVAAAESATMKWHPRIVFDGTWVAVAWIEETGAGNAMYLAKARRFSSALVADPDIVTPAPSIEAKLTGIGLAASGTGRYAVAFNNASTLQRMITFIDCSGP